MCRSESRLVPCPGAGCGIQTSPRPPGSAAPTAERRPGSATRVLWEEGRGWWSRARRKGWETERESSCTQPDRQCQQMQEEGLQRSEKASSVTKATVKVKDFMLADKTEHSGDIKHFLTDHKYMADGHGKRWWINMQLREESGPKPKCKNINHLSEDGKDQRYKQRPVIKVMRVGGGLG